MVRKHNAWTRARQKRSRPKTPAPTAGWVIADLSRITGLPVRRLRDYVARDLIQPLEIRGTATRYARGQLVRLLALMRLRAESAVPLTEIKRQLDAAGERDLESWVTSGPLSNAVREALGLPLGADLRPGSGAINSPIGNSTELSNSGSDAPSATPAGNQGSPWTAWHHVELLPGLVLQLSASASPAVKAAAKRIADEYAGG
jgi:DNA-binding transcriptional MerR regulator